MILTLLVDDGNRVYIDYLGKKMSDHGHLFQVDALHRNDVDWLMEKLKETPHLLFSRGEDSKLFAFMIQELKEGDVVNAPDMLIHFNQRDKVTVKDLEFIEGYVKSVVDDVECTRMITRRANTLLKGPNVQVMSNRGENDVKYYSFDEHLQKDRDIALFQIVKPHTNLPYNTIVVRRFSERGYLPIFTSSLNWVTTMADVSFMKQLWEYLGFEEEFDVDKIIKFYENERLCEDGTCSIPEVYKKSMIEVMEMFDHREKGILLNDI
jgi:hypothetical protein